MMAASPEKEMVTRAIVPGMVATVVAFVLGYLLGDGNAAWSAAIGVVVVVANFAASGLSLARAARVSLQVLYAVAMIGWVVRLGIIVALMAGLNQLSFFSPLAFGLAVMPATVLLLGYEMKLLAGGLGRELDLDAANQPVKR
jgi:hypothetical protein